MKKNKKKEPQKRRKEKSKRESKKAKGKQGEMYTVLRRFLFPCKKEKEVSTNLNLNWIK